MPLPNPAQFEKETLEFLRQFRFEGQKPSLEHLAAVARYFSRLPYENISKILKKGESSGEERLRLPDELTHDHFTWHLGGTCFSLTYFLCGIYTLLGYTVRPLICNLNWGANNHSAVVVSYGGEDYLIDPGYMIFKPLVLNQQDVRSLISAETGLSLRFDPDAEQYALYTFRKGNFTRRYQFSDQDLSWEHFAEHWKNSFELPGMDDLTLTRIEGNEMLFIQGDFVKITAPEKTEKFRENDLAQKLIRDRFNIPLEKLEEAQGLIGKAVYEDP